MKDYTEKEIFWKVLVWRVVFSIPLTMLVNYAYFHSLSVIVELTIVSNIIGYVAHYFFEMGWPKICRFAASRMKTKEKTEETK